ncbi:MAG: hypothetical protein WCB02_12620 [Bradyrhizobium sp.]
MIAATGRSSRSWLRQAFLSSVIIDLVDQRGNVPDAICEDFAIRFLRKTTARTRVSCLGGVAREPIESSEIRPKDVIGRQHRRKRTDLMRDAAWDALDLEHRFRELFGRLLEMEGGVPRVGLRKRGGCREIPSGKHDERFGLVAHVSSP